MNHNNESQSQLDDSGAKTLPPGCVRYYSPSANLKALFAELSRTEGYNIKADITKLNTRITHATLLPIKKDKI